MNPPPSHSSPIPADALLAESAWLRRLARRLVADDARADDLVQDTLIAALERGPAGARAVPRIGRAWLATVLRNTLRMHVRGESRRTAREEARAQGGHTEEPSAGDLVARLDAHRRLVEAVTALDEPYRTTIALRFLEDLAPREVAHRMDVPVKTVHTRIERGLARLRERLDRAFDGRREAWCLALGELARGAALGTLSSGTAATSGAALGAAGGTLGGLAMGTAAKWSGAAAVVVIAGWMLSREVGPDAGADGAERQAAPPAEPAELSTTSSPALVRVDDALARRAVAGEPDARAGGAAQAEPPAQATFAGVVVDLAGAPVAGVTVVLAERDAPPGAAAAEATSDAAGAFELPVRASSGTLTAHGAGWASVLPTPLVWIPPPEPPRVVVAPARRYGGRVVDVDGAPLPGVALVVHVPPEVALALRPGEPPLAQTGIQADADGRFRFAPVGFVRGARIDSADPGLRAVAPPLPDADVLDLVVTLEPARGEGWLAGVVQDEDGTPVRGAMVAAGGVATLSDARGAFALDPENARGREIRAAREGHLPIHRSLDGLPEPERNALVLVLGPPPPEIRGRVVDAAGEPVPNALVWSHDATPFSRVRVGEALESTAHSRTTTERVLSGAGFGDGLAGAADENGAFVLPVLDRTYSIQAMHPLTLVATQALDCAPGADVVLRLEDARTARVAGTARDMAGNPIAGAWVNAYCRLRGADGTMEYPVGEPFHRVECDADGRFTYAELAVDGTQLLIGTDDKSQCVSIDLGDVADPGAIEVVLPASRHLRVVLESDPAMADTLMVLDGTGKSMWVSHDMGGGRGSTAMGVFHDGNSGVLGVDETARTLVLYKHGAGEVRRIPLEFRAGEVLEIRL